MKFTNFYNKERFMALHLRGIWHSDTTRLASAKMVSSDVVTFFNNVIHYFVVNLMSCHLFRTRKGR